MKKNSLFIILILLASFSSFAQDRIFNYTYQTIVLNRGQKEIEVWTTINTGKKDYYRELQNRVEYEVGLFKNLQVAFYLNSKQKTFYDDITGEIVMDPTEISFSNEWKYKFSDPVADPVGFCGYAEFTIAGDELELELKAIFDKKIGRTLHALNLIYEPEWAITTINGKKTTEKEVKYDAYYGFAYNINKSWNVGTEILYRNTYIKSEKFTHSALFAGPTVAYNTNNFWINFSVSPQITGLNNPDGKSGLNTDEFTELNFRMLFSYWFN